MPSQLEVVKTVPDLEAELSKYRDLSDESVNAVLCELGGGVLRFANAAFPFADRDRILTQKFEREPEGRGPHFDIYGAYLDEEFPWLALFNLSGITTLKTVQLPADLAEVYFSRFPEASDEAFDARRPISELALSSPKADVKTGRLENGMGLLLPQREAGPHIVHEVTPASAHIPGEFVKAVVVKDDPETQEFLADKGYVPLDDLVSESLGAQRKIPKAAWEVEPPEEPEVPYRRSCNLD